MSSAISSRRSQADQRARRRQAPLSGRQGARPHWGTQARKERPVDTIAVARKLAEEKA
ncbi:hypothetical protein Atai01_81590 [Amycolatopsis taiwanensis]|uniref:Uncharacterized protein n=1 Tax=Amycolatopsis taiwanensis TaxID=342230 RepID=A0A9W6VKC1_9PSEU|nr:hypothetical protein Atai01_81590 [Amycolatopsis taiwanensis]